MAIRSNGGHCMMHDMEAGPAAAATPWQVAVNYRYFKSFRHFVGTEERKERLEQQTEVINYSTTADISLTRQFSGRWSGSISIPLISNARSSLYEHDRRNRNSTHSFGMGDVRLSAYYELINPALNKKLRLQAGAGLKLPTGDYRYQDYFRVNDSTRILGPVDQSIQLGDGGTGFTAELNAAYQLGNHLNTYANVFYLFNPREQNGVSTARGGTPSATAIANGSSVMSVPDQYMLRGGIQYQYKKLTAGAGIRYECIPVYDLLGKSGGFRRPGYVIMAEPVISYQFKKLMAYASIPWSLRRSRTQSVPDKIRTQLTGVYAHGDAAFADYSVNLGLAVRF
jgi:hypothetical protein